MIIYAIVAAILIFIKYYGNKAGFDKLETIWLIIVTIISYLFLKQSPINRLIMILVITKSPILRPMFYTWFGILFTALSNKKFPCYRILCELLYKTDIKTQHNLFDLPQQPTIILANYPSNYIEYLTHGLIGDKICLMAHGPAIKILRFIYGDNHLIAVDKGNFDKTLLQVKDKLKNGYHVFAYIERDYYNRKSAYNITELRSGMFKIAKDIKATITPIVIDHIDHTCGIIDNTIFQIKVGPTSHVTDIDQSIKDTKIFLEYTLKRMKIKKSIRDS